MASDPPAEMMSTNNGRPRRPLPYVILAFLCAAATIAYAQRQVVAIAKEPMQLELDLTKNQIGWVMSAFFIGYSVLQIPLGWIADRYGASRTVTACVTLSALATALVPAARTAPTLIIVWTICGMAQAGLFPIAARLIVAAFPATRRAIASGLLGSSMSVGAAIMAAAGGELLGMNVRWQFVVLAAAIPGFLWAIVFPAFYGGQPIDRSAESGRPTADRELLELLSKTNMWLICLQQFLRAAGYVFFVSWFSTYLQETAAVSIQTAGWLNGLPLLAVVVGSPIGGLISDLLLSRTGSRRISQQIVAITTLLACSGSIVAAFWAASPMMATGIISIGSFCAAMCGPIGYAVTMHVGRERVATAFAIMNTCGNVGAALFPIVAAQMRTATGDWNLVLALFAGIYVAAAICWMLIDPNGSRDPIPPL